MIRALGWTPLPHQIAPPEPWDLWALVAGRGSGKTDADAHYVNKHANGPPCIEGPAPHRIGVIAPTHDDAKKTCVVGDSGLLMHNRSIRFTPGGKSGDLVWPNGSLGNLYGAFTPEDIERLRGPQHCLVWAEELAAWRYLTECWDNMQFGLRLGEHPHAVASSTPKPRPEFWAIAEASGAVVTTATTDDNPHLHPKVRAELYRKYGRSRLGQQELFARRLVDIPGALWRRDMIRHDLPPVKHEDGAEVPAYQRVLVAIDPAVSYGPESDETGITVGGKARDGRAYMIDDLSGRYSPTGWAMKAIAAYATHSADAIVGEINNGGDMVEQTLRSAGYDGRFIKVTATRGKRVRAEPIAALYEQGRVSHVRPLIELEDQYCNFTPDSTTSPDRLDSAVWLLTELMLGPAYSDAESFSTAA